MVGFAWSRSRSDHHLRLLAGYREHTGRSVEYAAGRFLDWLQDEPATVARTTEFLWCFLPLQFRSEPEPPSDYPQQVGDFVSFAGRQLGWDVDGCLGVCADAESFSRRWHSRSTTPLPLWLEELRLWMTSRELESSIPPADPDDPLLSQALRDLRPGTDGLLAQVRVPDIRIRPATPDPCVALDMIGRLLGVVGAGTKLTATGCLTLAAGRALLDGTGWEDLFDERIGGKIFKTQSTAEIEPIDLARSWGIAAGLVRVEGSKLLPTVRGKKFGTQPTEDWWNLFTSAVRRLGWSDRRYPRNRVPFWAGMVEEHTPAYLRMALEAGSGGVALLPLGALMWSRIAAAWVTDSLNRDQVRWQVDLVSYDIRRGVFVPLEMLGAANTWVGGADGAVRLTPLGSWAVGRLRRELLEAAEKKASQPRPSAAVGGAVGGPVGGRVGGDNVIDLAARRAARP